MERGELIYLFCIWRRGIGGMCRPLTPVARSTSHLTAPSALSLYLLLINSSVQKALSSEQCSVHKLGLSRTHSQGVRSLSRFAIERVKRTQLHGLPVVPNPNSKLSYHCRRY